MRYIFIFLLIFMQSCKDKVSTVKNNETIAIDGSVKDFDYEDVKGKFSGNFNGKKITLDLKDNHHYYLVVGSSVFKDEYIFVDEGGIIELNNSTNMNLPFHLLSIEDPSLLVILNEDMTESNNFLENE